MSAKITSVVNCASSCVLFMYFFFLHLWWITWHIPHVCDVDCCVTTAVLVFSYAKQIRKLINVTHVYLRSQNTCRKLTSTSAQLRSEVGTSGIAATLPCSPAASSNYFHTKWASLSNLPRWFYYGFLFFFMSAFPLAVQEMRKVPSAGENIEQRLRLCKPKWREFNLGFRPSENCSGRLNIICSSYILAKQLKCQTWSTFSSRAVCWHWHCATMCHVW